MPAIELPEISPLLVVSTCGLTVVCLGLFGVVAFLVLRLVGGEFTEVIGSLFERDAAEAVTPDNRRRPAPTTAAAQRPNLRERVLANDNFDALVAQQRAQQAAQNAAPATFGENPNLRPTARPADAPPGVFGDNPNLRPSARPADVPPAPARQVGNPVDPAPHVGANTAFSDINVPSGGGVGARYQRFDRGRLDTDVTSGAPDLRSAANDGLRDNNPGGPITLPPANRPTRPPSSLPGRERPGDRSARNDDEFLGGMLDFDGDGDPDM